MAEDDDPTTIRSLALSPGDAASAYAYTQENPGDAVLRVTLPFHGRMRARIHVYQRDDTELTGAIHIPPASVIESDVIEDYPRLEATLEEATSAASDEIRKHHADAVEEWQARARESILEATTIDTDDGPHLVELKQIG